MIERTVSISMTNRTGAIYELTFDIEKNRFSTWKTHQLLPLAYST